MRVISLNSRNNKNPVKHETLNIGTLNIWELRR
jgi:hypothetical protein